MTNKQDCIFCKIINEEIPALKIYEDKSVLAFLDIAPINAGHTLFIPKQHFDAFSDLPDEVVSDLMTKVNKLGPQIVKAVGAEAFNIGVNNGKVAGQIIPHAHVHLIPRFSKDGLKHWQGRKYAPEVMQALADKIKKAL